MRIRNRSSLFALSLGAFATLAAAACSDRFAKPGEDDNLGSAGMALSADPLADTDIAAVRYTFTRTSCAGESIPVVDPYIVTKPFEDVLLTSGVPVPGNPVAGDGQHLFADAFVTLPAGCYDVVAQPVKADGTNSADCSDAKDPHVQIVAGQTTEGILISQCKGDPNQTGNDDGLFAVNHPPKVSSVTITPSKFVEQCRPQKICATASDPDKDPIDFVWEHVSGPALASGPVELDPTTNPDGSITQCMEFTSNDVGKHEWAVKAYDLMKDPSSGNLVTYEQWFTSQGTPHDSHGQMSLPTYTVADAHDWCNGGSGSGGAGGAGGNGGAGGAGGNACGPEICNGIDDDCDGEYDEGCATFQCTSPNRVWFFGAGAGLDFSGGAPVGISSPLNSWEGCAVLSCGNKARISTDGTTLYDTNNDPMPNGTGLLGEMSATQSALLVPRPGSNEIFVFNVEQLETGAGPLHYSVVDMSQRGGLGDVDPAQKNLDLSPDVQLSERMTSVKHMNGVDTWVVVHALSTDEFMAYLVSAQGLSGPVSSFVGSIDVGWGQLQASPSGTSLAMSTATGPEIYDFDRATGVVSNPIAIAASCQMYGIEFSPNGNVLYGNCYNAHELHQYDISSHDASTINASDTILGAPAHASGGAIQRGPDGKLYVAGWGAPGLSVVDQPNVPGPGAGFSANTVTTPGTIYHGLPNILAGSY